MSNRTIVRILIIGLGLIAPAFLVSCSAARLEAEAAASTLADEIGAAQIDSTDLRYINRMSGQSYPARSSEGMESSLEVDPADRKFYSGLSAPSSRDAEGAELHPADVKFLVGRNAVSEELHPADRKFLNGQSTLSEDVNPADRKFYSVREPLAAQVHPADVKFFNAE